MTYNCRYNPNVSKINPKDDISPNFEVISRDIQNWASRRVGKAMTEAWCYCKFFKWLRSEENNNNKDNGYGSGCGDGGTAQTSGTGTTCQQSQCVSKGNNNNNDGKNLNDEGDG
jgi:hypothetical protein